MFEPKAPFSYKELDKRLGKRQSLRCFNSNYIRLVRQEENLAFTFRFSQWRESSFCYIYNDGRMKIDTSPLFYKWKGKVREKLGLNSYLRLRYNEPGISYELNPSRHIFKTVDGIPLPYYGYEKEIKTLVYNLVKENPDLDYLSLKHYEDSETIWVVKKKKTEQTYKEPLLSPTDIKLNFEVYAYLGEFTPIQMYTYLTNPP